MKTPEEIAESLRHRFFNYEFGEGAVGLWKEIASEIKDSVARAHMSKRVPGVLLKEYDREKRELLMQIGELKLQLAKASSSVSVVGKMSKVIGTEGCRTCGTGRVSIFIENESCIECDPLSYARARTINLPTENEYVSKAEEDDDYQFTSGTFIEACKWYASELIRKNPDARFECR